MKFQLKKRQDSPRINVIVIFVICLLPLVVNKILTTVAENETLGLR